MSICYCFVLVLLTFANITNSNIVLTLGIVFQYNRSCIVHLLPNIYFRKAKTVSAINITKRLNILVAKFVVSSERTD